MVLLPLISSSSMYGGNTLLVVSLEVQLLLIMAPLVIIGKIQVVSLAFRLLVSSLFAVSDMLLVPSSGFKVLSLVLMSSFQAVLLG